MVYIGSILHSAFISRHKTSAEVQSHKNILHEIL